MPSVRSLADVSARPALWGFFISLALLVLSLLLRTWYPGFLENNWAERREHSLRNISGEIDHQFRQRSQFLKAQVSRVFEDQELFQRIREGTPARVAELFGRIESLRFDNTVSLEITDPQGTVLLWAGRSVVPLGGSHHAHRLRDIRSWTFPHLCSALCWIQARICYQHS